MPSKKLRHKEYVRTSCFGMRSQSCGILLPLRRHHDLHADAGDSICFVRHLGAISDIGRPVIRAVKEPLPGRHVREAAFLNACIGYVITILI